MVRKIKDGEDVDQATVNVPIAQMTQREQHLYEKFNEMLGKSVLISFDQPIHPEETLHVNELNVVYFNSNTAGAGLAKSITGFSSDSSTSMYGPNNSNYSFGVTKTVYDTASTADIYTEGLCEFSVDLDHATLGLIQKDGGVVETFQVGPYYLSGNSPGKITRNPSGIPVYIGYALSKRKLLLHSSVDEFSQFFINYRYHVLDRVAGVPSKSGSVWSIASADLTKLGWVPVAAVEDICTPPVLPGASDTTAVFYFNIPSSTALAADTTLTATEREEAAELAKYLPPVPSNFIELSMHGILQRLNDVYDTDGVYSVNEYGLWWHSAVDGEQPWSSDYPASAPSAWATIKTTVAASRPHTFVSFAKFNPALRTQLVSSLAGFNTAADNTTNFIKFYSKDNPSAPASTGDLLVSIAEPGTVAVGLDESSAPYEYPATDTPTTGYTAARAVAAIKYSKADGAFKTVITPVVAKLTSSGGVTVTESQSSPGVWDVGYMSAGRIGQVDSIEPINARLEFRGLTSYIKLPPPSTTPYGLIGKILLPKNSSNDQALNLILHMFGDTSYNAGSAYRVVSLYMEYSVVTAANSAGTNIATNGSLVQTSSLYPVTNPTGLTLTTAPTKYDAFTAYKYTSSNLVIPSALIREDSIVNFKLMRVTPSDAGVSYTGNIGLLGVYWEIPNV